MTRTENLRDQARKLREQLLGVRLLAQELSEEVQTLRHHVNSPGPSRTQTAEAVESLKRLDELLEPLLRREGTS